MAINGNYKDSTSLKSIVLSLLSMSSAFAAHRLLLTLVWPILSGLFIYVVLSGLTIPFRITVPLSVAISIIILGLSAYYGKERVILQYTNNRSRVGSNKSLLNIFFVTIYITSIIFVFLSQDNLQIFVSWQKITPLEIVKLGFAIGISIFMPGYGLISILEGKPKLGYLPKFLLSYIFSILITALAAYITALIGLAFSNFNSIFGTINLVIICLFVYIKIFDRGSPMAFNHIYFPNVSFFVETLKTKTPELVVFAGLFILVVISTYYLYSGTIIGDQWFHHGIALEFLMNTYKDYSQLGVNVPYPPLFSAFLASFFDLSGVPTVNAYVSLNFLNFMPIIAFYYFFVKWIPTKKRAALLATTLFTLSSGFGWIYVLNLAAHEYSGLTSEAVMNIFHLAAIKTFDISVPTSFINVAHPDITTSLIIISLPAGFVLLGLVREKIPNLRYASIIAMIILVFLFHLEFGLFVIIAIILYLIFERDRGNYFFIGALIGFSVVFLVALFSPNDFYRSQTVWSSQDFLRIPIIAIYFLLIPSAWALYRSNILYKVHLPRSLSRIFSKRINKSLVRFILGVTAVSVVSYLYILSFIVWDNQLTLFDIRGNTEGFHVVPWHFYPLRLGIIGLVGLAYLLSYTFKKFEKEVFVFGILAIVPFLIGHYYDEHRFSKYIMSAMVGFASLLIYKILLTVNQSRKQILNGLIISIFVVSSSLSVLMYISYTALGLEHPTRDFKYMHGKRFFPSNSEFNLINFLRLNMNPRLDNIAVPEQELGVDIGGIFSQLQSFAGVPSTRLLMSPSTLQEPTLEGLYTLLNNTRFIVLQKNYIHDNGLSEVVKFTLDNFERVYEDKNYVVLSVPHLLPPSGDGDIALISPRSLNNNSIPFLVKNRTLDYDKDFTINRSLEEDRIVTLRGKTTLWSNVTQDKINYIEDRFRVIGDPEADNYGGIAWTYGDKAYSAFIRPDRGIFISSPTGKELSSQSLGNAHKKWNTIKVVDMMDGKINIFLNDVLQAKVNKPFSNASISNVGIKSFNSIAQFEPIVIGTTQKPAAKSDLIHYQFGYYYSLTALALSKFRYDTFAEGDFSAFSKKNIILPFDPVDARIYLELANKGKTIIVLNTDEDFRGGFSDLLCIQPQKEGEKDYDSIGSSVGSAIEVSGTVRDIEINCPGSIVKSFYMKGGQESVPFVIEKEYSKGKIIFVNLLPYFASISRDPERLSSTLKDIIPALILNPIDKNISALKLNLIDKKYVNDTTLGAIPSTRFVGNLRITGQISIHSSSLLLPADDFYAQTISIRKQKEKDNQLLFPTLSISNRSNFNGLHIRNLKMYGAYDASVNSDKLSYFPSRSHLFSIPYGYIEFDLRDVSNMTIKLDGNQSGAEFFLGEDKVPIRITDGVIEFKSIDPSHKNMPILMKRPEINSVNGSVSFQKLYSNNPYATTRHPWANGVPVKINGTTTILKLNHVSKDPDEITKRVTYFDWIEVHGNTGKEVMKKIGSPLKIDWDEIITSGTNAKIVMVLIVLTVLTIFVIWSNPTLKRRLIEHKRSPV
jgi:hypothetical protein